MTETENELNFSDLFIPLTVFKCILFIVLIGIFVFFYSLFNPFVGDDHSQVETNSKITSLGNSVNFFLESRLLQNDKNAIGAAYFKPMLDLSFAIIYSLFGINTFGYHFVQLALYILNACLLFYLFKCFFKLETAFYLSLIFLVHPINHESAVYISALQEVLFTFFGLLSLLLVSKVSLKSGKKWLVMIGISLLLALFSKETGVLYLLISLVYLAVFQRKNLFYYFGVCAFVFISYLFLRVHAVGLFSDSVINAPIQQLDIGMRLITMPAIFLFYIQTFFFPLYLSSSHQWVYTSIDFPHFILPFVVDIIFLFGLYGVGNYIHKSQKKYLSKFLFFTLWFLLGVGFHLQFLALDQTVAERWFYFPIIGLLGIIGVMVETTKVNLRRTLTLSILGIILLLFALRTLVRTFDYQGDLELASKDISVSPESYNLEYMISQSYYQQNKLELAKIHAEKSVGLFPFITNYTNLGAIYSKMGDYGRAKESYLKALEFGDDQLPYENLASLSLVYGERAENIHFIKSKSLAAYPNNGKIWMNLSLLEYMQGNLPGANDALIQAEFYSRDPMAGLVRSIIESKKKLRIEADKGEVKFVLED